MNIRASALGFFFSTQILVACSQPLEHRSFVEDEGSVNTSELDSVENDAGPQEQRDTSREGESEDAGMPNDAGPDQNDAAGETHDAESNEETETEILGFVVNGQGALADVDVVCSCGQQTRTDPDGQWGLTLVEGAHTLTFSRDDHEVLTLDINTSDTDEQWREVHLQAHLVEVVDHEFLIRHFGGDVVETFAYEETINGFQEFLDATGVVFFSAQEISTPNNQRAASDCGYVNLLPPRGSWHKMAALGMFSDELRSLVGEPIAMRNWWRPPCYNNAVGGAAGGDHPDADAVDLDFRSSASRALAQGFLCENYWSRNIVSSDESANGRAVRLNMSVGVGGNTIHLGLLSSRGRRSWRYGSYFNVAGDGNCF